MSFPALREAARDPNLKASDYRLLGYLCDILIPGEYRTLKLWPVARELHMNKATASKAMRLLVSLGYLREGARQPHGGRAYMLVPVRGEPAKKFA